VGSSRLLHAALGCFGLLLAAPVCSVLICAVLSALALSCSELLWVALDSAGLLWAALGCLGLLVLLWAAVCCFGLLRASLLWLLWAAVCCFGLLQPSEVKLQKAVKSFKMLWRAAPIRDEVLSQELDVRAQHAQQVLGKQKDVIMAMTSKLHHAGRQLVQASTSTVLDLLPCCDGSCVDVTTDLNRAWQFAHSNWCGYWLADLGVYVLRNGMVMQPSTAASPPPVSCRSCILYCKANYEKPECCLSSAWSLRLECPCKAVSALHSGAEVAALTGGELMEARGSQEKQGKSQEKPRGEKLGKAMGVFFQPGADCDVFANGSSSESTTMADFCMLTSA
jgi:hypothetical protein